MSVSVLFNGTTYLLPTTGETGWGTQVTNFLNDVGNNAVSLTGSQNLSNKAITLQPGTSASPSLGFTGDLNTGLYWISADVLGFTTGGNNRLNIDASGNLNVQTGAVQGAGQPLTFNTTLGQDLIFKTNNTEVFRMAYGGVVTSQNTPSSTDNSLKVANTSFVQSCVAATVGQNIGRNKLHNPMFNIGQRGAGPWTSTAYTMDRWAIGVTTDTASFSQQALADADRTAIGDESAYYALQNVFTGNAAAGASNQLVQRIEYIRWLANKTVTVSFWAKAASGTPKLGLNILQFFGTGGSPSASVRALATGNSVTLSTTWTRYTSTIAIPSIVGKTLGTSGDYTGLEIWYSSGATNNAVAGNIGVQSGTIQLWGVQLEIGATATPLDIRDTAIEFSLCQRFYQTFNVFAMGYNGTGGGNIWGTYALPTAMRAQPTVAYSGQAYSNASALTTYNITSQQLVVQGTVTATGQASATGVVTLTADL